MQIQKPRAETRKDSESNDAVTYRSDVKTQRYIDVNMHTRKTAETKSTLRLEFSNSESRTQAVGLGFSDSESRTQTLGFGLSDSEFGS